MTEELEVLQGAISAVVYQNAENGYAVLRLHVGGGQNITVVGTIPLPVVGEQLMVTGRWSTHPNYGKQFEAEFLERLMPQSSAEILSYLSSRVIRGIGPRMAARIVDQFGDATLQIMEWSFLPCTTCPLSWRCGCISCTGKAPSSCSMATHTC